MRNKYFVICLLFGLSFGFAQRNTKYGQYAFKILPISGSYYSLDGNGGIRLGIENSFYDHQKEWVEGIQSKKSLWQVVGIFGISVLRLDSESEKPNEYLLGTSVQAGYRMCFDNTWKVEGFTGYQYLQPESNTNIPGNSKAHLWDITVGVGQDFKMIRESFITWFLRPGLNFQIQSSGLSFYGPSITLGVDYRFENVHIRPWKNPWFKSKDKALKGREFQRPVIDEIDEIHVDKKTRKARKKEKKKADRKARKKRRKQKVNLSKAKYKTGRR